MGLLQSRESLINEEMNTVPGFLDHWAIEMVQGIVLSIPVQEIASRLKESPLS